MTIPSVRAWLLALGFCGFPGLASAQSTWHGDDDAPPGGSPGALGQPLLAGAGTFREAQ
jgi:hypothetical protein